MFGEGSSLIHNKRGIAIYMKSIPEKVKIGENMCHQRTRHTWNGIV